MKHTHGGYGNFIGGDPRRFTPDSIDSGTTPEELAAWEAACKRWNDAEKAGEPLPPAEAGSCVHAPGVILTLSRFGLGGYEYDCDDPSCEEAQPGPHDPDDANAAFARWWSWDGRLAEVEEQDREALARRAFIAGFQARQELTDPDEDGRPF